MRRFQTVIAAILGLTVATPQAMAQSLTVIGNHVEMYTGVTCLNSCAFPQNTTGKIIKINYISCQMITNNNGQLIFATIGPSASPDNISLLKETFFDTERISVNGSSKVIYLSATPGILLGVGRYLAVTGSVSAGQLQLKCAATGIFAN